jgi:hypothetical protein
LIALLAFLWLFGIRPSEKEYGRWHVPLWAVPARARRDIRYIALDASLTVSGAEHEY